jgi:hypothetical protein
MRSCITVKWTNVLTNVIIWQLHVHVIFSIYSLNMNGNCWCICSREVKSVKLLQIIFLTLTLQME